MRPSIITDYKKHVIFNHAWFTVRPLTMEDVEWDAWRNPSDLPAGARIYMHQASSFCLMKVKPEVLVFPEEIKNQLESFYRSFFDPKRANSIHAEFEVCFSLVGVRKDKQYLVYNEALAKVKEMISLQGEKKKQEVLDEFNKTIAEYVYNAQQEYIINFVSHNTKVAAYIPESLDECAGTTETSKRIAELEQEIERLEKERHALRLAAIQKHWSESREDIPQEALEVLRKKLADNVLKEDIVRVKWATL